MNLKGKKELILNDIKLNYYEQGTGEVLLFIHGNGINGMDSRIFYKMYNYYATKYRVIAVDSRGQGLTSEGTKHYNLNLIAEDLIEFCKRKLIRKVTLIGYSDGANVALLIAKKAPELLKSMIIISGNYTAEGIQKWFRKSLELYRGILSFFNKLSKKLIRKIWLIDLMINDTGITEEDLRKINIPTLIFCAKFDVVYRKHTLSINKNLKNSILSIITNCDHKSIINKIAVIEEIDEFLEKNQFKTKAA